MFVPQTTGTYKGRIKEPSPFQVQSFKLGFSLYNRFPSRLISAFGICFFKDNVISGLIYFCRDCKGDVGCEGDAALGIAL